MAKSNTERTQLLGIIKKMLGERASMELLKEVAPDIIPELKNGTPVPVVAELLVNKVVRLALDPKKSNQWAVELIFDRVEGKAVQGRPIREDGRVLEDRLDEVTATHLNSIAAKFAKQAASELSSRGEAENKPAGPAAKLLDLHKNRADSAQAAKGQSALAPGITESGG